MTSYVVHLVAWFSVSTMIFIAVVAFFTVPIAYRRHKTQVDGALDAAAEHARRLADKLPPPVREHLGVGDGEESKKTA